MLFSDYLNKDIQLTNLRLGNVFGVPSAHKGDFSNLLVNQLVKSIACGVTFEVKSDKNTMRNFISRDDFCDLLLKLVSGKALLESGPLNMGGKDISITNMVELVSDIFNKHYNIKSSIKYLDKGPVRENKEFWFNCNLAKENGLVPANNFKKTLLDLYGYCIDQRKI